MKINIFEGARRVTRLIMVFCIVGAIYVEVDSYIDYEQAQPKAEKRPNIYADLMTEDTPAKAARPNIYADLMAEDPQTSSGNAATATTKPMSFEEWDKANPEQTQRAQKVDTMPEGFYVPQQPTPPQQAQPKSRISFDEWKANKAKAEQQTPIASRGFLVAQQQAYWEKMIHSELPLLGIMAFFSIFSWSIGWIVRGFMGIPSGQDFKS
jgi:hypothetical protein